MRIVMVVKMTALLALFAAISVAQVKNVAVVETELDAQSGASADLNSAEVRQVTAELRRGAVENLQPGAYNIMTSETIQALGGAVLEDCADENSVVALGGKIGANYIVRGIISKFQTKFTLTVEIYETEKGNLVASSDPVRSENLGELLENASAACANMYKKFADTRSSTRRSASKSKSPPESKGKSRIKMSAGGGALFAAGVGGGITWRDGEAVAMPYSGGGAYLFFEAGYAEIFAGYSMGGGKWKSAAASDKGALPDVRRSYMNIGVLTKYPVAAGSVKLFPLLGIDYEAVVSGEFKYANGDGYGVGDRPAASNLSAFWVKLGGGVDFNISESVYLRAQLLYGLRMPNNLEKEGADFNNYNGKAITGQGFTVRTGVGVDF